MLFFNKVLPLFVLPEGILALLLLLALWRKQRWPLVAAIIVLYLGSIPLVEDRLIGWLETRYPAVPIVMVEPADAIVVLGGILGPRVADGFVPNFLDTSERFDAGLALLRAGKARALVFTGARTPWEQTTLSEGSELKRLAIGRGIAPENVIVTREIDNTATEAAAVADLLKERGWRRVILVTTGWHMPRSAFLFKKAGVNCTLFPVDFRCDPTRAVTAMDFVPKGEAWQMTETALRELYGNAFYRLFR